MPENDLARKIRDLRAKYGLTLEQVAQQVGVGRSTVRKWETGLIANMRRDKIVKLAQALHTTPGYLMGWESPESMPPTIDSLSDEESIIIQRYRCLDDRGKDAVLNVLNYEFNSLPGEKTDSPAKQA